jgi:hypothetical protein
VSRGVDVEQPSEPLRRGHARHAREVQSSESRRTRTRTPCLVITLRYVTNCRRKRIP